MSAILLSLASLASTAAGGLCALRLRGRGHVVLGFTTGAVLGVACFHLVPDSIGLAREQGGDGLVALLALAGGLLAFHALKTRLLVRHGPVHEAAPRPLARVGLLSAAVLAGHSFLDGICIGLAFQVSRSAGLAVAVALLAHDFCDGVNTVSIMLAHGSTTARALGMLALDAIAPLLGAASTLAYRAPAEALVLFQGFLAGVLLHVGASGIRLLVRSRARAAAMPLVFGPAAAGLALVYGLARLAP
jgi:ZIP family zinc transporter